MATIRMGHTATRLADGRVLVVGGAVDAAAPAAELFDPAIGWAPGPSLVERRRDHAATFVGDAVLVTGGVGPDGLPLASAERLTADAATPLAPMEEARASHTTTALLDGRVLVVGGVASGGVVTANAELWDGVAWRAAGTTGARVQHVACPLASGDVLVAGGQELAPGALDPPIADASRAALRFDAASGSFSQLADMPTAVTAAAWAPVGSTCLLTGGAAHAGVIAEPVSDARLLNETATAVVPAGPMVFERRFHTATTLPGARVLVVGGSWLALEPVGPAELFEGICVDEHTAPDAEREPVDCSPYACSAGACRTSCETVLDCAQGTVCDASKCVPPPDAAAFGGCDCSASRGAGDAPPGWLWAAIVALAARLSGRRSCRSPAASRSTARSRGTRHAPRAWATIMLSRW